MQPDVRQIQSFYASPLGQTVAEIVGSRLRHLLDACEHSHRGNATDAAAPGDQTGKWLRRVLRDGRKAVRGSGQAIGKQVGLMGARSSHWRDEALGPNADITTGGASQFKPRRWQPIPGDAQIVVGLGYATPYLSHFEDDGFDRVLSFMPRAQGVTMWPAQGPYRSALVDPSDLPLPNACADVVLAVHHLEMSDHPHRSLREIWRVLRPEGCLIMLAPNRTGLWAPTDSTPFGHGRPYSIGQMTSLMRDTLLEPEITRTVLNAPPLVARRARGLAKGLERAGGVVWPALGGAIMVVARKRTYAPIGRIVRVRETATAPVGGLAAAHQPAAARIANDNDD